MSTDLRALAQKSLELAGKASREWPKDFGRNDSDGFPAMAIGPITSDEQAQDDQDFIAFARTALPELAQVYLDIESFFGEDPRHVIAKLETALGQAFRGRDQAQAKLTIAREALEAIRAREWPNGGLVGFAAEALEAIK